MYLNSTLELSVMVEVVVGRPRDFVLSMVWGVPRFGRVLHVDHGSSYQYAAPYFRVYQCLLQEVSREHHQEMSGG